MDPYILNSTPSSISVQNVLIPGMSLGTIVEMHDLSKIKSKRRSVELVKSVSHWFSGSTSSVVPIIQSPDDPAEEHPVLKQPAGIDYVTYDKTLKEIKTKKGRRLFEKVIHALEKLLQNESERKINESENFSVTIIQEKHLGRIPKTKRKDHVTLGMRGAIANKDLEAGTPLIYCARYLDDEDWHRTVDVLERHLIEELNIPAENAWNDAQRRIQCYAFQSEEFQSKSYNMSAYGAGNVCAMINHDKEYFNMKPYGCMCLLDKNGAPVPEVTIFYTHRDVKKGEQLLVNYGDKYKFDPFYESRITVDA